MPNKMIRDAGNFAFPTKIQAALYLDKYHNMKAQVRQEKAYIFSLVQFLLPSSFSLNWFIFIYSLL